MDQVVRVPLTKRCAIISTSKALKIPKSTLFHHIKYGEFQRFFSDSFVSLQYVKSYYVFSKKKTSTIILNIFTCVNFFLNINIQYKHEYGLQPLLAFKATQFFFNILNQTCFKNVSFFFSKIEKAKNAILDSNVDQE